MKYLKKFLKVLIWPIVCAIGQFFIQYIFIYAFNLNEIKKLNILYPKYRNLEINKLLNKLIKTSEYNNRLTDYINSKTLLIIIIIFIIMLPILYKGFKKYKTKNKIKLNNILIVVLLGISICLIYNISIFNLNNIFNFTNQFKLSELPIYVQIISSGIVGPILEELTFRGIVYNKLKEFNKPMKSIILSTLTSSGSIF